MTRPPFREEEVTNLRREIDGLHRRTTLLSEISRRVTSSLDLPVVLQDVVNGACVLTGARFGALAVFTISGRIQEFITHGLTPEERQRIGRLPEGLGILGWLHQLQQPARLANLTEHPRSVGFPPNHPAMKSFLGAPVRFGEEVLGNLYLTEKAGGQEFSPEDEQLLVLFASQAASAIRNARLHQEVQELATVQERERIAREIHDGVGQLLGYINIQIITLRRLLSSGQIAQAQEELAKVEQVTRDLYADVWAEILSLRTASRGQEGLLSVLQEYIERYAEMFGIKANLKFPEGAEVVRLTPSAEFHLMRIIQEALTNIRKYAGASAVEVTVSQSSEALQIVVADNGQGFDPNNLPPTGRPRFGLQNMRERAEAIGGSLTIETERNVGTRLSVRVPLGRPAA